jgi:hypothetical protein
VITLLKILNVLFTILPFLKDDSIDSNDYTIVKFAKGEKHGEMEN